MKEGLADLKKKSLKIFLKYADRQFHRRRLGCRRGTGAVLGGAGYASTAPSDGECGAEEEPQEEASPRNRGKVETGVGSQKL